MRLFTFNHLLFEVSDPAGGGGAGTATAPGTAPQGQGQAAPSGEFNWGLFPNIPEEHRALLEPHLRGVQGHVTQLEQQLAPLRPFLQSGMTPEAATGLLQFSADFDADPRGMWIRIGEMLQEDGQVDKDLDLEYLAALAAGENPPDEDPTAVPQGGPNPDDPVMQRIEELQEEVRTLRESGEQEKARRTEAIQDQLLNKRMDAMREELKGAGWPEELISDESLTARIIVHKGDIAAATKSMVDERSGILKGFTQTRQNGGQPLDLSETPPVPGAKPNPREGSWGRARASAEQRLRQNNRGAAQE